MGKTNKTYVRKYKHKLLQQTNFKCMKCGDRILSISSIQKHRKILKTRFGNIGIVWWVSKIGTIHSVKIATIEHIKPRGIGGTNSKSNLTAYCYECNWMTDQETRK